MQVRVNETISDFDGIRWAFDLEAICRNCGVRGQMSDGSTGVLLPVRAAREIFKIIQKNGDPDTVSEAGDYVMKQENKKARDEWEKAANALR